MKKKWNVDYKKIIRVGYLLGLAVMAALVIAVLLGRQMPQEEQEQDAFFLTDEDWTLDTAGKEPADLAKLGSCYDEGGNVVSIYYRLPEIDEGTSLVYRSKDVYTRVLADNELVYETQAATGAFYNKSPGNLWNTCRLPAAYSGKTIEMQVEYVYDTNAVTVDHIYLGNEGDIVTSLIRGKAGALLISIFMILAGLFMVGFALFPKQKDMAGGGILYMGTYALFMGVGCILETNVIQFFIPDGRLLQMVGNIVMVASGLPLFLYMDCEYEILKSRSMRALCLANVLFVLVCGIGQLTGLTDLHNMLTVTWLFTGVFFVALVGFVVHRFIKTIKSGERDRMLQLQMAGIIGLWLICMVEIVRFTHADTMDRAQAIRLGMLVFIVLFAVSSELNAYKLMQNGLQYDIIRSLAYQDGLTRLGNRTSYLEQLDHYDRVHIAKVGMVFLDVNNLKSVNDNLGHEEGDKLIKLAAEVIVSTFGNYGKSYRIGGDEFCVFLEAEEPELSYRRAKEEFYEAIHQVNSAQCYPFYLQIAHGYAQCENANKLRLKEMADKADTLMYINKEQLKRSTKTA